MPENTEEIRMKVRPEMKRRIRKKAEEGDYSGMSDYARSMIRAGESNIADLDPRTGSSEAGSFDVEARILNALTTEYQEVDDALDPVLSSVATRLHNMAEDDSYPVEHDPRKGYRITKE
jgi:Arc/MetJ-type ribon-helix-helix transcriptional regulator